VVRTCPRRVHPKSPLATFYTKELVDRTVQWTYDARVLEVTRAEGLPATNQ